MAKIPESLDLGNEENLTVERLLELVKDMYKDLAVAINKKPDVYFRDSDGSTLDTRLNIGDININSSTQKIEMLSNKPAQSTVTWTTIS